VLISDRLRSLREEKKLSQGDIEKRTGLPAATSRGLRTAIRFQPLRPLRNSRVL